MRWWRNITCIFNPARSADPVLETSESSGREMRRVHSFKEPFVHASKQRQRKGLSIQFQDRFQEPEVIGDFSNIRNVLLDGGNMIEQKHGLNAGVRLLDPTAQFCFTT